MQTKIIGGVGGLSKKLNLGRGVNLRGDLEFRGEDYNISHLENLLRRIFY